MIPLTNFISKLICGAIIISGQMIFANVAAMPPSDNYKSSPYESFSSNISTGKDVPPLTSSSKSTPISISFLPTERTMKEINKMYDELSKRGDSPIIIYQKLCEEFGDNEENRNYIDKLDFKPKKSK